MKYILPATLGILSALSLALIAHAAFPLADFNGDGCVDQRDVDFVKAHSGTANPTFNDGDVNGDNHVDSSDIAITKSQLGNGCSTGGSHHSSHHHGSIVIKAPPKIMATSTAVVSTSTGQVLGVMLSDLPPTGADKLIKAGKDN